MNKLLILTLVVSILLISGCDYTVTDESGKQYEVSIKEKAPVNDATTTPEATTPEAKYAEGLNTRQIMDDCLDRSQAAKMTGVKNIKVDCMIEKSNSLAQCKDFEGREIYEYTGYTRNFEKKDVEQCIFKVAIKNNDYSICNEAGDNTNLCYWQIAVNKKDLQICKQSPDISGCYVMYSSEAGRIQDLCKTKTSYTPGLTGSYSAIGSIELLSCLYKEFYQILETGGIGKEQVDINVLMSYFPFAVQSYEENNQSIQAGSFALYYQDISKCDGLNRDYKIFCYRAIAKNTPSFTLKDCDKMGADYPVCYSEIALRDNNPDICNKVPSGWRGNCILGIALNKNDFDLCEGIGISDADSVGKRMQCYYQVATNIGRNNFTYELCEKLSTGPTAAVFGSFDDCFYETATRELNLDTCNSIQNADTKKQCTEIVQHAISSK